MLPSSTGFRISKLVVGKNVALAPKIKLNNYFRRQYWPQKVATLSSSSFSDASSEVASSPQSFDYSALKACIWDLQERWTPSRVENVIQHSPRSVSLHLRTILGTEWLIMSWDPVCAHIGSSSKGPRRGSLSEVFPFGEQIRSILKGLILIKAEIPVKWERVARLSFADRPQDKPKVILHLELMGKHSNIIFTDNSNDIILVGSQIGSKKSSQRCLQVKGKYSLPPVQPGIAPSDVDGSKDFKNIILSSVGEKDKFEKILSKTFRGVGPNIAKEILSRAGVHDDFAADNLSEDSWLNIYSHWFQWFEGLENNEFFFINSHQIGKSPGIKAHNMESSFIPLEYFGSYYGHFESNKSFQTYKEYLLKSVRKGIRKLEKKQLSLREQQAAAEGYLDTKLKADMIMSSIHLINQGQATVEVENWETGTIQQIKLDPSLDPIKNAEKYYKIARKEKRGIAKIQPLLAECELSLEYLNDTELQLDQVSIDEKDSFDLLSQIEKSLIEAGMLAKANTHKLQEKATQKARKSRKKGEVPSAEHRKLQSPNGFEVLIGRSSQQNDKITMHIAKPGDIWMHARGFPGAHVLLRTSSGSSLPEEEDISFAANLAAYYSKGAKSNKVDVTMADPKDIFKPKGAKAGQVLVKHEKVIVGVPGNVS